MELKEIIAGMLKQNTGIAMMDSGGEDGRHWQRNQGKDFESEPRVTPDYWNGELQYVTVSLYHFLNEVLDQNEVSDAINTKLDKIRKEQKDSWDDNIDNIFECHEWLEGEGTELFGISKLHKVDYTYNYDNFFSQDFQNIVFIIGDNAYVMLQIHNGADARGGFTSMKCFRLEGYIHGVNVYGSITVNDKIINVGSMSTGYSIEVDDTDDLEGIVDDPDEFEILEEHKLEVDFEPMDALYVYFD